MKRSLIIIGCCISLTGPMRSAETSAPHFSLNLSQAIEATFEQSHELQKAVWLAQSAEDKARAQRGPMFPRLSIEGSYRHVSEVPELAFPGGQKIQLTDNKSYSIGPELRYPLFKGGADYYNWKSSQANARSLRLQENVIRRQQRLGAELAFFQTQLAAEQVRLLVESYKVVLAQYKDIKTRYEAGSAAKIDLLSARQQMLTRQRQLLNARAALAVALREVSRLSGLGQEIDAQRPLDGRTPRPLPDNVEEGSVILDIPAPEATVDEISNFMEAAFDNAHPGVEFLSLMAEASNLASKSLERGRWPELTLLGRVSRDYPNGPIEETITQKTIGGNLSFPLFTGGALYYNSKSKKDEARAKSQERDQAAQDLLASYLKARDQAWILRDERPLNAETVREAEELAKLQYESYKAGRARYLDVEDANLRVLEAKTEAANTDVRLLIQLATLESLSDRSPDRADVRRQP